MSVYVTEQFPPRSVHLALVGVNVPLELLVEKVTSPDGVSPVAVAVQVVNVPTWRDVAEHDAERDVVVLVPWVAVTVLVATPLLLGPQTAIVIGSPTQIPQPVDTVQVPALFRVPSLRALPKWLMTILVSDQLVR